MTKKTKLRRKSLKSGHYKPMSKTKRTAHVRKCKQLKNQEFLAKSQSSKNYQKIYTSKLKVYNRFFLNNLEAYRKHQRSWHFRNINDILEFKDELQNIPFWHSALVLSFVTSKDFVLKLQKACKQIVIVTDGFKNTSYVQKKQENENMIWFLHGENLGTIFLLPFTQSSSFSKTKVDYE